MAASQESCHTPSTPDLSLIENYNDTPPNYNSKDFSMEHSNNYNYSKSDYYAPPSTSQDFGDIDLDEELCSNVSSDSDQKFGDIDDESLCEVCFDFNMTNVDMCHYFGHLTFQRGSHYSDEDGRVFDQEIIQSDKGVHILQSKCWGTRITPYNQQVTVKEGSITYTQCSCPMKKRCKHCVAAILTYLYKFGRDIQQETNVPRPQDGWETVWDHRAPSSSMIKTPPSKTNSSHSLKNTPPTEQTGSKKHSRYRKTKVKREYVGITFQDNSSELNDPIEEEKEKENSKPKHTQNKSLSFSFSSSPMNTTDAFEEIPDDALMELSIPSQSKEEKEEQQNKSKQNHHHHQNHHQEYSIQKPSKSRKILESNHSNNINNDNNDNNNDSKIMNNDKLVRRKLDFNQDDSEHSSSNNWTIEKMRKDFIIKNTQQRYSKWQNRAKKFSRSASKRMMKFPLKKSTKHRRLSKSSRSAKYDSQNKNKTISSNISTEIPSAEQLLKENAKLKQEIESLQIEREEALTKAKKLDQCWDRLATEYVRVVSRELMRELKNYRPVMLSLNEQQNEPLRGYFN